MLILGMNDYLNTLTADYESAEISSVVLHNRKTNVWNSLLTIIELIPSEQEVSQLIGDRASHYCDRENIDADFSIYITRRINYLITEAVEIFRKPEKGITIGNTTIKLFSESNLELEPASEFPLIINNNTEKTFGAVLPTRHSAFRVWAKIDRPKKWLSGMNKKQIENMFLKAGTLTKKHLGFDLSLLREHSGNLYLCGCNPYLRRMGGSLIDHNKDLLMKFSERKGRSVIGMKLVLEDDREGNPSFSLERTISSRNERILLPHLPNQLITKLYDLRGYLIESHQSRWISMHLQMNIQTAQLNLTVKEGLKKKKMSIPKFTSERPMVIGKYDHSLSQFLKEKQKLRQLSELERTGDFIFFPGGAEDKVKARNAVSEMLNKASKRCMLLDPYFGAPDLYYAYLIQNTSVPVQILTSAAFLKSTIVSASGKKIKQAFPLKREVEKFKRTFPCQSIEVKVLSGGTSPLHDRYIVIDEKVYLLGSSFNEFGSRATTLIKVPHPELMIIQALTWWNDTPQTYDLEGYIKHLKKIK